MNSCTDSLFYTDNILDRSHLLRADPPFLASALQDSKTRTLILWQDYNLVKKSDGHEDSLFLTLDPDEKLLAVSDHTVFLGFYKDTPHFAVDLSTLEQRQALTLVKCGEFTDLRTVASTLEASQASLLAYARGMIHWHRNHLYCSRCGQQTASKEGGHIRVCTRESCRTNFYPRVDPAVIVLIEHHPKQGPPVCLLARHPGRQKKIRSTLAGFVEPGESLEATVKREMMEEVGLEVDNIQYVASQPWPFPSSLMLGFTARAETTVVNLDPREVEEADWYSASEIEEAVNKGKLVLSREDSIARFLIREWVRKSHAMTASHGMTEL